MTQPPPPPPNQPPNQPPQQGGFGPPQPPQDATPQDSVPQDSVPQNAAPQPPAPNLSKAPEPQSPPQPPAPGQGAGASPSTPPPPAPSGPPQPEPGYGYPQAPGGPGGPAAPPAGPGYGYPAQPGAPAPGPSAYGHPQPSPYGQPQPNPYGQPQTNPYGQPPGYGYPGQPGQPGQPGYGYPGQPTVPMQPQVVGSGGPAGPGRKINAQVAIIVAAVVAIALIVGGGVWYANSGGGKKEEAASSGGANGGGGDKGDTGGGTGGTTSGGSEKAPADPSSDVLFKLAMPVVKKDDNVGVRGSWLTDKAYVKTGVNGITGYDPAKGTKLWSIALPGPVCEASRFATDDHRTAVVFQSSTAKTARCDQIAAIDLAAGKQLWKKTVTSGDYAIDFDNVTVSANTVAVGSTEGGAAFDVDSGKVLWSPKPADTCYDAGYGGGPKLVAVRKCGAYDNPELHIQTIDPVSGKVLSEYKLATGIDYASVVSTEPLVVAADVGDSAGDGSGISDFFSIDNKTGKLRTRISVPGAEYAADCEGITRIEACTGLAVGNDRIYVPTEEHDGSGSHGRTNEVVAFDLATGKQTGQRADAGDGYTIYPLRMDGSNLIAYKRPPYDKGGQVVSVDGGSFKETVLLENAATDAVHDLETGLSPEYSEVLFAQGRLYMSEVYVDDDASSGGDPEYLAVGFGTAGS
ncbi:MULTISPECIES: outer membrane protein assembly factor BamB family protein [unclassified Streptomyces]|uniref:outer membrane protein assembly factor BamB family protein n=1 Tax=unclassified Streptomyces TaxID=2593676 RepID=UPI002E24A3E2